MDNASLGRQIKTYRLAAGLSLRELARQLTVSAQALSQYETGRIRPRPKVMYALADALGFPEQPLPTQTFVELESVHIVDPYSRSQREIDWIRGSIASLAQRYLILEQQLGGRMAAPSLPTWTEINAVKHIEDAEDLAQDVRRYWNLGNGPLSNIVSLFETRGIRVFEVFNIAAVPDFTACSAFVTLSGASRSEFPLILLDGHLIEEEKRIQLCRNLAFMILPSTLRKILTFEQQDLFASRFAEAIMLPTSQLRDRLSRRRQGLAWYELTDLARQFGISYSFIVRRCRQVGIISRDTYRNLKPSCQKLDEDRLRQRREEGTSHALESSTRLWRLALRAVTEGLISPKDAAALLEIEEAQFMAWLQLPNI